MSTRRRAAKRRQEFDGSLGEPRGESTPGASSARMGKMRSATGRKAARAGCYAADSPVEQAMCRVRWGRASRAATRRATEGKPSARRGDNELWWSGARPRAGAPNGAIADALARGLAGVRRQGTAGTRHALADPSAASKPVTILSLRHLTHYRYAQPVALGEHRIMVRPQGELRPASARRGARHHAGAHRASLGPGRLRQRRRDRPLRRARARALVRQHSSAASRA